MYFEKNDIKLKKEVRGIVKEESKLKKIIMYQTHFAWLEVGMLKELDDHIKNLKGSKISRTAWIKKECYKHLGVKLESKESLEKMDESLKSFHYSNKAEWLKERIRININS